MFASPMFRAAGALIALTILAAVLGTEAKGLAVSARNPALLLVCFLILLAIGWIYETKRPNPLIAAAAISALTIALYTNAMAVVSYVGTAYAMPLRDAEFAGIDRALGFDWLAHTRFVASVPWLGKLLNLAYQTSAAQVIVGALILLAAHRTERLAEFVLLYVATSIMVIVISALVPAEGAYVYWMPGRETVPGFDPANGVWHLEQFRALRSGAHKVIEIQNLEGLVTFPSFHTALAIIQTFALRRISFAFWPFALLNALVIVSTLAIGGHYLIDVIAGAAIAAVAIAGLRLFPAGQSVRTANQRLLPAE